MHARTHRLSAFRDFFRRSGGPGPDRGQRWLDMIAFVVLMFAAATGIGIVLGGVVLLLSGPAAAAERATADAREARQGMLLGRDDEGRSFAVPLLNTEVVIDVSGPLAHARVVQTFRNPSDDWFEGVYVFPLPDNAAVSRLTVRAGGRVIEGEIQERALAAATYRKAKASGQRAALVEQERPNLFTTSVANIGPREDIEVELEYRQTLDYRLVDGGGSFSLRFPMVVGPRYVPAGSDDEETGGAVVAGTVMDDAQRIQPAVAPPGTPPLNPVRIRVRLDAGVPIAAVDSPYHAVHVLELDAQRRLVTLSEGNTPANRDFELTWTLARGQAPSATLFTQPGRDGGSYALLMLVPPAPHADAVPPPREVVFVIDTSGSMEGESIVQAREALTLALARLRAADRFNVIAFNHETRALFDDAVDATSANVARASRWVAGLRADGGTEIAPALKRALDDGHEDGRLRQVVFLTDGAVGNEQELFTAIRRRLGDTRLFTVGIGSAPNGHFMRKAAEAGRGSYTYIGKVEEVGAKMGALFARLETPALTGIQVRWPDGSRAETWPAQVPDLYLGEPVLVAASLAGSGGEVMLSGRIGAIGWTSKVALADASPGAEVASLWARRKIEALMDELGDGAGELEVRRRVVPIAVEHRLLTRYTSFVAVDRTPARPDGAALNSTPMPTNLAHGWNHAAVFGELPRGATDARWHLLSGLVALTLALPLLTLLRRRSPAA